MSAVVTIGTIGATTTLCPCCGAHHFKQACGACGFEGAHHATWSGQGLDHNPVGDVGHHRRRLWAWFHEGPVSEAEPLPRGVQAALRSTNLEALERRLVDRLIDQGPRPTLRAVPTTRAAARTLDAFLGVKATLDPGLGGLAAYHVPRFVRAGAEQTRAFLEAEARKWQAKASHRHMTVAELVEAQLAAWVQHHDPRVVAARKYGLLAYAREDDGVGPLALSWVEEMV